MAPVGWVLIYTAVPLSAACVGGVLSAVTQFGAKTTSTVQHFAAGVVVAAAAGELMPEVLRTRRIARDRGSGGRAGYNAGNQIVRGQK